MIAAAKGAFVDGLRVALVTAACVLVVAAAVAAVMIAGPEAIDSPAGAAPLDQAPATAAGERKR